MYVRALKGRKSVTETTKILGSNFRIYPQQQGGESLSVSGLALLSLDATTNVTLLSTDKTHIPRYETYSSISKLFSTKVSRQLKCRLLLTQHSLTTILRKRKNDQDDDDDDRVA